jgi:hypothetical protein
VEATPDGSRLFVGGGFNTVNGVAAEGRRPRPHHGCTPKLVSRWHEQSGDGAGHDQLDAVRRRPVHPAQRRRQSGLGAVNTASGAVATTFSNDITGGIGVNGALGVHS